MTEKQREKAFERFSLMCRIDPDTMAAVMAWNNMSMEFDIPEDTELQKRYTKLVEIVKNCSLCSLKEEYENKRFENDL